MKHLLRSLALTLVICHLSLVTSRGQGLVSTLEVQKSVKLGTLALGTITPTELTADTDDWAPTGFSVAFALRVSTDASHNLGGIAGGTAGRVITLENVGSFSLVLKNAGSGSTAANRFALTRDYTLEAGSGVFLKYDGTASRWVILGNQPTPWSSATLTNTGGNLTNNYFVLGAGTVDTKVAPGFTTDGTSKIILGVAGTSVGSIDLKNATSGTITIHAPTGALGTSDITLPIGTVSLAPLDSPAFTGTPLAPTASAATANTQVASTAYADNAASNSNQNSQSGNYTLVLSDRYKTLLMTSSSANALTIPPNSSVAFPVGTRIPGWTTGSGATTITPGSGVSANSRASAFTSAGQHAAWMIEKVGTDAWEVTGDLVP